MESATLTESRSEPATRPDTSARLRAVPWPLLGLIALCAGTIFGFFYYPTYPNYDSVYSLVWGRELLDGQNLSFDAYRAPTQHPLAILFGAALTPLGEGADRVMLAATLVSFVVLVMGMYRLASRAFTPLVGLVAAGLLCTRFDFPFLAARGYLDIPFLALVLWAAAFEQERPRRGDLVFVLLLLASLLRPEGWLLIGLYFLWCAWPADWRTRIRYAAYTAAGPVIWAFTDLVVTGDPLFSHTHTSGLAEDLGRASGLSAVPSATVDFLVRLDKGPIVVAGIAGLVLAGWLAPRRVVLPLALFIAGLATFAAVGVAGLSVIQRYLLVPSLMVMVFAAVAIGGFTLLREGTLVRRAWMGLAILAVLGGTIYTATRVNLHVFDNELRWRGDARQGLGDLLDTPAVQRGVACGGVVSVPNHKLIPDVRWLLDLPEDRVIARSDPEQGARTSEGGVAIYGANRTILVRQVLVERSDSFTDSLPLDGYTFAAANDQYGAYVRC